MTARHLVTDGKLALAGDEDLDLLDDSGIDVIAALDATEALLLLVVEVGKAVLELTDDLTDLVADRAWVDLDDIIDTSELAQEHLGDLAVGRDDDLAALAVDNVERDLLAEQDIGKTLGELLEELLFPLLVVVLDHLLLTLALGRRHLDLGGLLLGGDADIHDDAVGSGGNHEGGVLHVGSLLAEDGSQEPLLGRKLRLALRCDLSDEDVAGLHFGTDADHAIGTKILQGFLTDVRDVAGDLLGAELGVTRSALELVDVDGGVDVLLDHTLGDEDGVLEVITIPRHERDQHVAAEGKLAVLGVRAVRQHVTLLDHLALLDDGLLVDAGAAVGAHELAQFVDVDAVLGIVLELLLALGHLAVLGDDDALGIDGGDLSVGLGDDHSTGIPGDTSLHAGPDDRGVGDEERNALALHVRAHERAVGVVMLEEGDEPCCHGDKLLGGDIHVLDLLRLDLNEVPAETRGDSLTEELALCIDGRVGLGDVEVLIAVAGEILDLISDTAVHDLTVRGLDEAEVIDAGVGRERADESDVRTFRSLDRADATVVRGVHVTHLEAGTLTGETSGPECRETTLVRQLGQGIGLIHELAQLGTTKEVTHDGAQRLGVDELLWRDVVDSGVVERHALADKTLGAGETHAALVGQEFADGADATASEVIDVVRHSLALAELQEITHGLNDVLLAKDALVDLLI